MKRLLIDSDNLGNAEVDQIIENEGESYEQQLIDKIHRIGITDPEQIQQSQAILAKLIVDGNNQQQEEDNTTTTTLDWLSAVQDDMIMLRVGGGGNSGSSDAVQFYTCNKTIETIANTLDQLQDRNPHTFTFILEYLRNNGDCEIIGIDKLNLDQLMEISREAQFFKLTSLQEHVDELILKYHLNDFKPCGGGGGDGDYDTYTSEQQQPVRVVLKNEELELSIQNINSQTEKLKNNSQALAKQLSEKYQHFVNYSSTTTSGDSGVGDASVNLNIAGQLFNLPFSSLAKFDEFLITQFIKSPSFKLNADGHIFIDRSPDLFRLLHGYIISHGNFNHFPPNMSNERKHQLCVEAKFFGLDSMVKKYLDPCRYPIEKLSPENIALKEREDKLREIFVKDPNSELLKDPYLFLSPLFEIKHVIQSKERFKINYSDCPKLLNLCDVTTYSKQAAKMDLVSNLETFKQNFYHLTRGLLEGLDWRGVFVAGGSILGCCLKESPNDSFPLIVEPSRIPAISELAYYEDEEFNDSQHFHIVGNSYRKSFFMERKRHLYRLKCNNHAYRKGVYSTVESKPIDVDSNSARQVPDPNIPHAFARSDIDLFLYAMSEEEAEEKIKDIYQLIKKNLSQLISFTYKHDTMNRVYNEERKKRTVDPPIIYEPGEQFINDDVFMVRTKFAVTFYMYQLPPIQIVLRIYKSPAEILLGFDVDCCTVGFDGSTVWCSDRAIRALSHRTNLVDVDRQSTTYSYRLFKYAKRGFSVSVPGYHHSLVKNQYLHYPRRVVCSHVEDKLDGLAKLILYDFACRSRNPKKLLGTYYEDDSLRSKQLELSKTLQKSDYLDLTIFKYDRKTPQELNSHFLLQSQPNTTFFIYALNDLDKILNDKNSLIVSNVPNRIEWITIEPTTQRVGSFNPITKNFYHDAYHPVSPKDLLLLDDLNRVSKKLRICRWYKSARNDDVEQIPNDASKQMQKIGTYRNRMKLLFQRYPPNTSNLIEKLFRQFLWLGNPIEVHLTPFEKIDFQNWKVVYSNDHPLYPNSSDILHREVDQEQRPSADYEDWDWGTEKPKDCKVVVGLCRKSFY